MKKAHEFDMVFDCQKVYRKLLEAFSNPGRVVSISEPAERLNSALGAYIAVANTLIDNETSFHVMGSAVLSEMVQQFTYGKESGLKSSDFIFIMEPCDADQIGGILDSARCGTLEEPHLSATVFVRVQCFEHTPKFTLKGPGIDGRKEVPLCSYASRWIKCRKDHAAEYPSGVDLVFITDSGELLATPRLVQPA